MAAIYKRTAVQPAFDLMRTRRVDVIMIGDSNQLFGGTGRDHGWGYALRNAYGLYSTGLIAPCSNFGSGNGQGYLASLIAANVPLSFPTSTLTGTVSTTNGSKTVTGSGTSFLTDLVEGQPIFLSSASYATVKTIESDTSLTLVSSVTVSAAGQTVTVYPIVPEELRRFSDTPLNEDQVFIAFPPFYVGTSTLAGSAPNGVFILRGFGTNKALTGHAYVGNFPTGSGSFRAGFRREDNFQLFNYAASPTSTNGGAYGMVRRDFASTALDAREGVDTSFRVIFNGGDSIIAPFFLAYYRVSDPSRTAGACVHTLVFRGGRSLRRMALDLQQINDDTLSYNLQASCDLQTGAKTAVVVISSGLNDRNETGASVGPLAVADGDSPEAYADNIQAIINRVSESWIDAGHLAANLFFAIEPSHPISSPNDTELEAYIDAARDVADANPRTCVIDMTELTSYEEMQANGWYAATNDRAHLSTVGYECLGTKAISEFVGVPGLSGSQVIAMSHILNRPAVY